MVKRVIIPPMPDEFDIGSKTCLIMCENPIESSLCETCNKADNCTIYNFTHLILPIAIRRRSSTWNIGQCCYYEKGD